MLDFDFAPGLLPPNFFLVTNYKIIKINSQVSIINNKLKN